MMLTHAQLLDAVRAAGRGRESFTCADVRQQLGLSTGDRKQLNRFYSRFRALQNDPASQLEKLASNCYRLRVTDSEPPAVERSLEVAAPRVEPIAPMEDVQATAPQDDRPIARTADVVELVSSAEAPSAAAEIADSATVSTPAVVEPAPKSRAPWLSRMASFFGRRGGKSEVASSVAVGV